ncbi:MAG: GlcG/HbpS family heme-binding protein [Rhodopila sp.]
MYRLLSNAKISVAVCGRDGRLIALSRMDGCTGWDVDRSSMGVATAAAIIGHPSDQLSDRCTSGLRIFSHANVVTPRGQRGGLPIVEEGAVEGGCGVSGAATAEESEECTKAGIAALNSARTEPTLGAYPQVIGWAQRAAVSLPVGETGVCKWKGSSQESETQRN